MICQPSFDTALNAYLFEFVVATAIARHREYTVICCYPSVLLDDAFRNVHQADIGIGVGLLSACDNP